MPFYHDSTKHASNAEKLMIDVGIGSSDASASKAGKVDVQKKRIRVSDMHHGLVHTNKTSIEATTNSQTPRRTVPEAPANYWAVFDCLTDRLRRKAAEDTILHLGRIVDVYKFESQNALAEGVEGLPFLNEGQLVDMINRAKMASGSAPVSGEPSEVSYKFKCAQFHQ